MRVLVVGGAGYIGSHVLRLVCRSGHAAWAYDNLHLGNALAVPPERLIVGDVRDRPLLTRTLRDLSIDAVMHFAAFSSVGESMQDPGKYFDNNVAGGLSLLEAMRAAEVRRLVFAGTTAVYGVPRKIPISESEELKPINVYGATKLIFENAVSEYVRAYDFGAVVLRFFNAAGASPDGDLGEDHRPESHLIPSALQTALGHRGPITIFGDDYPTADGTCIRDYIHVDDLAAAHLRALERLDYGCEMKLNLGLGRGFSVREVVEACRRVSGRPIEVVVGPRRAGDPPELVADPAAAHDVLGWVPRFTSLEEIVTTAWRWHLTHPDGYAGEGSREFVGVAATGSQ